jgi:hypothetical protein
VEKQVGGLGCKWRLQRNSSIAKDQGLQPDLVILGPDGARIIVEICCNNLDYDAENIMAEATVPGVDRVLAITPDHVTANALLGALEKAGWQGEDDRHAAADVIAAAQCLKAGFDWVSLLIPKKSEEKDKGRKAQ